MGKWLCFFDVLTSSPVVMIISSVVTGIFQVYFLINIIHSSHQCFLICLLLCHHWAEHVELDYRAFFPFVIKWTVFHKIQEDKTHLHLIMKTNVHRGFTLSPNSEADISYRCGFQLHTLMMPPWCALAIAAQDPDVGVPVYIPPLLLSFFSGALWNKIFLSPKGGYVIVFFYF